MPCLYGVAIITIDSHITGVAGVTVLFSTVNRERLLYYFNFFHISFFKAQHENHRFHQVHFLVGIKYRVPGISFRNIVPGI